MIHICNNVTCSCGTKYCSNCCNGCPGCGKGKTIISVASTTNAEPTIIYMDKQKEDIFKTIMETPDSHSVPTAKLQLHVEPKEDWEKEFEKLVNEVRQETHWGEQTDSPVHRFGYKTQRQITSMTGTKVIELFTVTDWKHIKDFIKQVEKEAFKEGYDAAKEDYKIID